MKNALRTIVPLSEKSRLSETARAIEPEALGDLPTLVAEPVKGFELQTQISGQSKCLTHSATKENVDSKVGRPPSRFPVAARLAPQAQ